MNVRHINHIYPEAETISSIYKDEVAHFQVRKNQQLFDARANMLIDIDSNIHTEDTDSDSEDSAFEDDGDVMCGNETLIRIKKIRTSDALKPNYLQRMVCVTQSYIVIVSRSGGVYSLCHHCYYNHANNVVLGEHSHVNTHYRRSNECCTNELCCTLCEANLSQIVTPEVCIICLGSTKTTSIANHTLDKSIFL